jgi:hypothetical protein
MDGEPLFAGDSDIDQLYKIQKIQVRPHLLHAHLPCHRHVGFQLWGSLTFAIPTPTRET